MRLFLLAFALFTASCATPVAVAITPERGPVEECLVSAPNNDAGRRTCIGAFAGTCINLDEANQTTGGMVRCTETERRAWILLRDRQVAALREQESPSQIALLTTALEEHDRWTQTRCAYAASIYEGGSLARLVLAQCMLDAAAEFTIELLGRYDEL